MIFCNRSVNLQKIFEKFDASRSFVAIKVGEPITLRLSALPIEML